MIGISGGGRKTVRFLRLPRGPTTGSFGLAISIHLGLTRGGRRRGGRGGFGFFVMMARGGGRGGATVGSLVLAPCVWMGWGVSTGCVSPLR